MITHKRATGMSLKKRNSGPTKVCIRWIRSVIGIEKNYLMSFMGYHLTSKNLKR